MEPILRARDNPMALRIVAGLFVLQGLLTAVGVILKLCRGHLDLNLMLLCLWIGPGLLRHSPTWRKWALVVLWFSFFAISLLAIFALLRPPLDFKLFGFPAAPVPTRASRAARPACSTMNRLAPLSRASDTSRPCSAAGTESPTSSPR